MSFRENFSVLGIVFGLFLGAVNVPVVTPFFISMSNHLTSKVNTYVDSSIVTRLGDLNSPVMHAILTTLVNVFLPAILITLTIYFLNAITKKFHALIVGLPVIFLGYLLLPATLASVLLTIILAMILLIAFAPNIAVVFIGRVITTTLTIKYISLLLQKQFTPLLDSAREISTATIITEPTAITLLTIAGIVTLTSTILFTIKNTSKAF